MRAVILAVVALLAVPFQVTAADPKPEATTFYDRGLDWLKKMDYDKAIADFDEALRLDPSYVEAYFDRGNAWYKKQDYDKAIADFSEAFRLDPNKVFRDKAGNVRCGEFCALSNRGFAWLAKQDYDKAIADFSEAIRLDPDNPEFYDSRGYVWRQDKKYDKALGDFDQALRLDPDNDDALNAAAWIRATCPLDQFRDGKQAVELATRACKSAAWKYSAYLDTLAAACAEAGDFDRAIEHEGKAIELEPVDGEFVKGAKERLALYKDHKPFRED